MTDRVAWSLLACIVLGSLAAPLLAPHNPLHAELNNPLAAPTLDHLLGTDLLGRDIFSRLLYGGRHSLLIAASGTLIACLGGLVLGIGAASHLPALNLVVTSLTDALLAAPSLLTALVVITLLDNSAAGITIAVGIAGIPPFARTTSDALAALRGMPYIESAQSIGANEQRILLFHLLPNARPTLLAFTGVTFSWSLLNSAALSFLGFLGNPNTPNWGVMLANGRATFTQNPWEALSAGLLLTLSIGAVNRILR